MTLLMLDLNRHSLYMDLYRPASIPHRHLHQSRLCAGHGRCVRFPRLIPDEEESYEARNGHDAHERERFR